jgi:homoserine kinase type II
VRLELQRLKGWWVNLVLCLDADGERLVLRRYGLTPPPDVEWELALLRHLAEHDFPTIRPLAARDGTTLGEFQGKPAVLYPYVEGRTACGGVVEVRRAIGETAAVVAELHRLTVGWRNPHPRAQSGTDSRRMLREFLAFCAQRGVRDDERALARLADEARRALAAFDARLAAHGGGLPQGTVHHDAHCNNVLFDGDRFVALIDFDDAYEGALVDDLAVMIADWAAESGAAALRQDLAAHVVCAYQRSRRLTAAEVELLPDCVTLFLLGDATSHVRDGLAHGKRGDEAVAHCHVLKIYQAVQADTGWPNALRRAAGN